MKSVDYYPLPLQLDMIMQGKTLEKCSLDSSIRQHIHLIITTSFGEMQHDEHFGCVIWDCDFDNLTSNNKIREKIKNSIQQSVTKYEPRLESVKVEIYIKEEELNTRINGRQVKKRLDVQLTGIIKVTSGLFKYNDHFFTGPLSYY
jgi:phage baseplate assembly protein W